MGRYQQNFKRLQIDQKKCSGSLQLQCKIHRNSSGHFLFAIRFLRLQYYCGHFHGPHYGLLYPGTGVNGQTRRRLRYVQRSEQCAVCRHAAMSNLCFLFFICTSFCRFFLVFSNSRIIFLGKLCDFCELRACRVSAGRNSGRKI